MPSISALRLRRRHPAAVRPWPVAALALVLILLLFLSGCTDSPVATYEELDSERGIQHKEEAESVVLAADAALAALASGADEIELMGELLPRARAVVIFPSLIKGGFLIGAGGGTGVLLVRHEDGTWSDPAFVSTGGPELGLFIGAQASKAAFIVMSDGALDALLRRKAGAGAEVSVAAASFGIGQGVGTTANFGADIYSFADTAGLYGGFALKAGAIVSRPGFNQAYYHALEAQDQEAIVLRREFTNPHSAPLRVRLTDLAASGG